ncbi:DUF2752 domain-containing protein [Dermacoccaceae bacterium W4C1]
MATEKLSRDSPGTASAAPAILAGIGLLVAIAVPVRTVEAGPTLCPFRLATGLPCPACGLTRSWVLTAHGHLGDAFAVNVFGPLTFLAAVLLVIAGVRAWFTRSDASRTGARAGALSAGARRLLWWSLTVGVAGYGLTRMVMVHSGSWPWPY